MRIGVVGLGRMGAGIARRLRDRGHECVVYDRDPAVARQAADGAAQGRQGAFHAGTGPGLASGQQGLQPGASRYSGAASVCGTMDSSETFMPPPWVSTSCIRRT